MNNKLIKNWKLEIRNWRLHSATLLSLVALFVGFTAFFALPSDASAAVIRRAPNNFGLVGYWSFDDARGSTATDFSGNGNAGTLTNMDASTDWVSGKRGKALDFDGSDDYVGGIDLNPQINNNITISVWVKPDSFSSSAYQGIVTEKYDPNSNDVVFELFYDGSVNKYAAGFYDGNWHKVFDSSTDTETNVWKHLTATYDGSTLKLYKNGKQMNSTNDAAGLPSGDLNWEIGRRHDRYGDPINNFNSTIDNVRIYDRALSSSEVKDLYNAGGYAKRNTTGDALYPNKLVSHWTMDGPDISGQTVKDVHSSNDGTKNGDPLARRGRLGQALDFDGNGDYVATEHFYNTNDLRKVSVSAWFKSSSVSDQIIIASDRSEYWRLGVGSDGVDGVQWTVDRSDKVSNKSKSYFEDGNWHHIAAVFDASLTYDHKLYIDGELDDEWSVYSSGIGSNNVSHTLIGVGSEASSIDGGTGPDFWMDGKLDDVRLYDEALSTSDVQRLYTATKPDTINSSQNEKLTDGLVGMWSFDGADVDLSSSTAEVRDASGNGNHGDAKNGASPAIGRIGQAYDIVGTDSEYISVGNPPELQVADGDFAVSAWSYTRESTCAVQIVDKGNNEICGSNNGGWSLGKNDGRYQFRVTDTEGDAAFVEDSVGRENEWVHSVGIKDGNTIKFYINGELVGTSDASSVQINEENLYFGGHTSVWRLDGRIDNVRVYDRALSADEVQRLYSLGR